MTDTETKLRNALENLVKMGDSMAFEHARKVLRDTSPKHPVEVEWEKWWNCEDSRHLRTTISTAHAAALHFAKWGLNNAAELIECDPCNPKDCGPECNCDYARTVRRIRDAAAKIPSV